MTPHAALILDRFLTDTALAFSWGGGGATLMTGRRVRSRLLTMLRRPFLAGSSICAVAAVAALPVQTAVLAGDWQSAIHADILAKVAIQTNVGVLTVGQAIVALAIFGSTVLGYNRTTVALSWLALCGTAMRGHAGADGFALRAVAPIIVQVVHVLSTTAWVAALVPFILILRLSNSPELQLEAVVSMRRFSSIGHVVVAIVLLSGIASSFLILGHLPLDTASPYQRKLMLKIAAVLAMTCLALVNRYMIVPRSLSNRHLSQKLLTAGATAEISLGLMAFALVASFGLDDPA